MHQKSSVYKELGIDYKTHLLLYLLIAVVQSCPTLVTHELQQIQALLAFSIP